MPVLEGLTNVKQHVYSYFEFIIIILLDSAGTHAVSHRFLVFADVFEDLFHICGPKRSCDYGLV